MIPMNINITDGTLPDAPGVYLYFDSDGVLLYVGKATSLKRRVSSYFQRRYQRDDDAYARRIAKMVSEIVRIEHIETPSVIEALVLEASIIRARRPRYNVLLTDDKSFLYLVFTNEAFPRPMYVRGVELARKGIDPFSQAKTDEYLAVYGPFTSPNALRNAMGLLRRVFQWSVCRPPVEGKRARPCFDAHIGRCPGVCTGAVTAREYRKTIRALLRFFEGKKPQVILQLRRDMMRASARLDFERAAQLKRHIEWLTHIQDVSVVTKDFASATPYENPDREFIDALGRVEAFDISNISGTSAVGSMVVFERGRPKKSAYRKFRIKTVQGSNDVAMMREVLSRRVARARRFPRAWPLPDVFVIDGGRAQVNAVVRVLDEAGVSVPVVGLAKGRDRKRDELVFDRGNAELARIAHAHKETFQRARDEAHRFAVAYHKKIRSQRSKVRSQKKVVASTKKSRPDPKR